MLQALHQPRGVAEAGRVPEPEHLAARQADEVVASIHVGHVGLVVCIADILAHRLKPARVPGIDPAAQVVEQIVRAGVPAAAFQPTRLLNRPSLAFVHEFYRSLATLGAVDVAMAEARRAIQLEEGGAAWGMPQLASRVRDGKLFALKTPPPPPARPRFNLRSVFTRRTP